MAESTFTQTGVNELRVAIERLPAAVTAALRDVAHATALHMQERARALWRAQRKEPVELGLADAITVAEDAANKRFIVESKAPRGRPANVPMWIEHGTVKMPARAYMEPAAEGERAPYAKGQELAAETAAKSALGT